MAEPSVAEVVLSKGVLPLLNYYAHHPSVCKMLLRRLITLWATSEKRVRVVAFVAIFRLAQNLPPKPLEWVLKVRGRVLSLGSVWAVVGGLESYRVIAYMIMLKFVPLMCLE